MSSTTHELDTELATEHYRHLLEEGFTNDEITELEAYGCRSISRIEALKLGIKKWNGYRHVSDGGLYFPFHHDYGQIRLNQPIEVDGRTFKYLGPSSPVKAWYPKTQVHAITEGWKDAAMPTVKGISTAAIVGVDNIIYCIPIGCETPIIFDSDGWQKPQVVRALVIGSLWTNGRINLLPQMPHYPTGGACEFFKSGGTISEYQALIDNALTPAGFISEWINHWAGFDKALKIECARVATELTHMLEHPDKCIVHLKNKVIKKRHEWAGKEVN